jgi:hypothetical protein
VITEKKELKEDDRGAEGSSVFFSPSEKLSIRRSLRRRCECVYITNAMNYGLLADQEGR